MQPWIHISREYTWTVPGTPILLCNWKERDWYPWASWRFPKQANMSLDLWRFKTIKKEIGKARSRGSPTIMKLIKTMHQLQLLRSTPTFEVKFVLLEQNSGKFVARLKQPVVFENKPQHVVVFQSPGSWDQLRMVLDTSTSSWVGNLDSFTPKRY